MTLGVSWPEPAEASSGTAEASEPERTVDELERELEWQSIWRRERELNIQQAHLDREMALIRIRRQTAETTGTEAHVVRLQERLVEARQRAEAENAEEGFPDEERGEVPTHVRGSRDESPHIA